MHGVGKKEYLLTYRGGEDRSQLLSWNILHTNNVHLILETEANISKHFITWYFIV